MKMKNLLMTTAVLACMFMFVSMSFASPSASILYNETNLGGGSYQYDYIFNNTSTSGESLYKVFFYFNNVLSTTTGSPLPGGWVGTVWTGTHTNTFVNTMTFNQSNYIAAGNSLDGFSFTIDHQIGNSDFAAEFKNNQGTKYAYAGTTTVVPEPVSTTLFLTGGAVFAARRYIKRKSA